MQIRDEGYLLKLGGGFQQNCIIGLGNPHVTQFFFRWCRRGASKSIFYVCLYIKNNEELTYNDFVIVSRSNNYGVLRSAMTLYSLIFLSLQSMQRYALNFVKIGYGWKRSLLDIFALVRVLIPKCIPRKG